MPVIQGRTRLQLRKHIGHALGAMRESTASGGSTSTVVDNTVVLGGADNYIGKWLVLQDADASTNDGAVRRVTDSAISSNVTTFTFMPVASASVASSDTYELWDGEYPPSRINDLINQSIISVTGLAYDPIENISLHADKRQTRFDVPSNISMVSKIEYREKVTSTRIHDCGSTFDEKTDGDFTQSLDTQDRKLGGQSLKMVIAAGASAGDFVTDSITSKDLSKYDTVEMWVKITGISSATTTGNLKLLLDDTASCASPLETLEIPALSADTWTFVRMSLSNPETDTAIISVGLEYDSDLGACAVWIDDIKAVANDTAEWAVLSKHLWQIDKEARGLVLVRDGKDAIGYALMKLTGGDKPALLTDDSSTTEIDGNFIIAHATNLALISSSGGPATDPDAKRQLSAYWSAMAERARKTFPMLVNVRTVE